METIKENLNIVIITIRNPLNPEYIPAEESFASIIFNKLNIKYAIIPYTLNNYSKFFGKLPCLYINGKVITNNKIPYFIKDLVINDIEYNKYFDNLLHILKLIQYSDEYYSYSKKIEKFKNKNKFIQFILNIINKNRSYENISMEYVSNKDITKHFSLEEKYIDLLKNCHIKLNLLQKKKFNNEYDLLNKFLIYSYLKEDKTIFNIYKRPIIDTRNEGNAFECNINLFKQIENLLITKTNFKIIDEVDKLAQNYKMSLSIKKKEKKVQLQETQLSNNLYHTFISLGIFVGISILIYYLGKRKNK